MFYSLQYFTIVLLGDNFNEKLTCKYTGHK